MPHSFPPIQPGDDLIGLFFGGFFILIFVCCIPILLIGGLAFFSYTDDVHTNPHRNGFHTVQHRNTKQIRLVKRNDLIYWKGEAYMPVSFN